MKLQDSYIRERNNDQGEIWEPPFYPKHIANVSLICYDERRATLKQVEAIAKEAHMGNINAGLGSFQQSSDSCISGCKRTSCISDIFEPDILEDKRLPCLTPEVILIEGAQGIGKTILSREIAFQWACKKLLCNVRLLFLVPLRDSQLSKIKSLEKFVNYAIKSASNTKHIIDYLEEYSGKYCTIVFDGYDEISEKAKEYSFVGKIIKRDVLQHCSLVITSRPSASVDLHRIIDRRVEILGFTKENRNAYIRENLKDDEITKINEYLQNTPFINDLCYIPLNMTILLCIFKGYTNPDNLKLPETQTDINALFIYITMSRFISKQKNESVTIKSPDDLPKPYKRHFNVLCKLAYILLGSDKIVVSESDDDIQKCIPKGSITDLNTLGLLREANYYSVMDNKAIKSYSFVHLSMQECLAAHYVAKEVEDFFLKNHFWDSRYLNTGIMYVGLTKGRSKLFINFASGHSGSFSQQLGLGKPTVHSKIKILHFFHCLLEAKNDELSEQLQVNKVLNNNIIDLSDHVLQQKDIHTLSFFLSKSTTKKWKKLNLSNCRISDEGLKNFAAVFLNNEVTNVSISTIDLSGNNLSSNSTDATINLISCFKVKNIIISDSVAETLEFRVALLSSVAKIEEVAICISGESSQFLINYKYDDVYQTLINQLQFKKHLYAWNANILLSLTHLIVKCNTLTIYEENLSDGNIDNTGSELKTICEERNIVVAYVLQSASKIIAYKAEFYQITQSLNRNNSKYDSKCKIFDLRQCNIGDQNLSELNKAFCQNHVEFFDKLIIFNCGLTPLCIPTLLEILKYCVIKHLKISDDLICNVELSDFILTETATEGKIKNFRMSIPLMLYTTKTSKIYLASCIFKDSILLKDYDFVNAQLYFTNIQLNEENIQSFLKICRNNKKQINVLDMKMKDKILNDLLTELEKFQHNAYLLASTRRLIACNVKQQQIMEAITNNSYITTLQLINCKLNLSKLYPLGKLLSNSSHNWKLIDFSGCNIEDEGCLDLYEYFTANKNKIIIEVLNLSSNRLSSQSIIVILKFFEFCVIKTLIISKNNIPVSRFNEDLRLYLLANKLILNFKHNIPLLLYESKPSHEFCNVYTFQETNMKDFVPQSSEDSIWYNLYQIQYNKNYYFDNTFSVLLSNSTVKVYALKEGTMNEKIRDMITRLMKYKHELTKVDYSDVSITDESCKVLCDSLFNDVSSLKLIEELDFSSQQFSLTCAPIIIESLQYCVIKHIILPNIAVLDKISETIIKNFHAGKNILNFAESIPLTINIETETEDDEEDGITYSIIANTYLQNYEIKEDLFNHYNNLVINAITTSHTFVLLDCLKANTLDGILSILYTKASYIKIYIYEIRLTDDVLDASVNHLKTLKKQIYRDRLQYVVASNSKIVAYNAKYFQILQALQIKSKICDLEIIHCFISNNQLKTIALTLIGAFNLLKTIKLIACKIKDKDFFDFCGILCRFPKAAACLKTLDLSHNHLTSSCIGTILKLLQCFVIEKLVVSKNSINDSALTDAIFQLARYKWTKVCNLNSGIPLVLINAPNLRHCKLITDKGRHVTIFHMNCEIDENLLAEFCCILKNIYCLNSLVIMGHLRTNLSKLCHLLPSLVKVIVYEKDLQDELAQEAATCLKKETQTHINYILASNTKILANRSSYHQIAPLLDSNTLINTLQVTNFDMQLPSDCRFVRAFKTTSRNWEMIDLSCCNIGDDGCLKLQQCVVASKSTIRILKFISNNLSPVSAVTVAKIILNCNVKKVNILNNKLQNSQINNALSCLKQNSTSAMNVEIISFDSTTVTICNMDPKLLPHQLWSFNNKIQLSIMNYLQFHCVDHILTLFHKIKLSRLLLLNNGISLELIKEIIKKFPRTNLYIEETYMQYNFTFIDYTFESLMNNLLNATKDNSSFSPLIFSSLLFIKVDMENNQICLYDNKIICNSIKDAITRIIQWQMSTTLVAVKLSNCNVTTDIAMELASVIKKITDLKLFELSCNHIQESDLKVIITALKSTKSLMFFSIKSINCFIEDTAEDIASIIARNKSIKYLEISNFDMKQSAMIKIAKSIKELKELKQLNLSNIVLTCEYEHDVFTKISGPFLEYVDFSGNQITKIFARFITSFIYNNYKLKHIDLANCEIQETELTCITDSLALLTSLKYLNCSNIHMPISQHVAGNVAKIITNNVNLEHLDIRLCYLTEQTFTPIVDALKQIKALKYLNVSFNYITFDGASITLPKKLSVTDKTVGNGIVDDYDTDYMKLIPPYSSSGNENQYESISQTSNVARCKNPTFPTTNEASTFHDDKNENSDDYSTHLITVDISESTTSEETLLPYSPISTNAGDFDNTHDEVTELYSLSVSKSSILLEIPPSHSIKDKNVCDYDTISIAGETALQHSQASELTRCYTSSESLLADNDYDTVLMIDDMASSNSNERLETVLGDDYKNFPSSGKFNMRYSCDQNSLIERDESENESVDDFHYEDVSTGDEPMPKYLSSQMSENSPTYHYSSQTNVCIAISEITEVVNCNCFLEYLDISDCYLSDLHIATLALALSKTSTLKHLNLSCNKISSDDTAYKLSSVITNNLSLKSINLSNCCLQESGIIIIAEALANITSLLSIDMSRNSITDNSMQSMAAAVGENLLLEQLNLGHCFHSILDLTLGIKDFLKPLTMLTCLKYLDLHSSNVSEVASEFLSIVIANNKSLSHLDLTNCNLPSMKVTAIATKLQSTCTLKFLSLSSNVIVNEAAYELAEVISKNFVLEYLALSDCKLEERGFIDIAKSLLNISSLKHLDLSYNIITDRAAETLAYGIVNNIKLTYLDLGYCTWQDVGFTRIQEIVFKLPMVKEFDIRSL